MSMICRENVDAYERPNAPPPTSWPERQPWLSHPSMMGARHSAPLWIEFGKTRKLKTVKPIQIAISSENGWFFAENDSLCVSGAGHTLRETLEDLADSILHLFRHYQALSPEQVTGDAIRLKRIFDTLFEEVR